MSVGGGEVSLVGILDDLCWRKGGTWMTCLLSLKTGSSNAFAEVYHRRLDTCLAVTLDDDDSIMIFATTMTRS